MFHNNPLELRGSRSIEERVKIIQNTDYIFFVSEWVKNKFFANIDLKERNNCEVLYPAIDPIKKINNKKKKTIIFTGKLNSSKGYDIFLNAITKILKKYDEWNAIADGNEPREKFNIRHSRLKIINWKELKNEIEGELKEISGIKKYIGIVDIDPKHIRNLIFSIAKGSTDVVILTICNSNNILNCSCYISKILLIKQV